MQTILRKLGSRTYQPIWQAMQEFSMERSTATADEIWILEHPPVYTLGLNGKQEHLLDSKEIPVVNTDRGGQVTYHGPGQLIIYTLLDLERLKIGVREIVTILEQAMIAALSQYGLSAVSKPEAPGVYVGNAKIGSVGLRIKKHCCYHGLSLNNNMDLKPFNYINTCGYPLLDVTQLADFQISVRSFELAVPVVHHILKAINQ